MLNLIKKLAVIDSTAVANVVLLDNIMSGVDGASTFGYSLTPTALQVNDGQRQQYKFTHQLDVRTLEPTSTDAVKLAVIERDNNTAIVSGLTENGFLYVQGKLTRNDQYDQIVADRFLVTADTLIGYNAEQYAGDNLLAIDDIITPAGFLGTASGHTCTVSGDEVTVVRNNGTSPIGIREFASRGLPDFFILPFEGERFLFQINVTAISTVSGTPSIELRFLDSAGASLLTSTQTFTGTGTVSVSAIAPSGTARIQPLFRGAAGVGSSVTYKQPLLSRGSTVFTL